jgi:hypothetical protein
VRLFLARQRSLLRVAEEGLEGIRRPLLSRGSVILPVGRVSAPVSPPLRNFFTRLLFLPFLTCVVHEWLLGTAVWTGGRPRGACGEGGTTGAADLLSAGHSPHSLACVQALPSSSVPATGRPHLRRGFSAPSIPS